MTSELIAKNLMSEIEARIMNVPQVLHSLETEKVIYTVSKLSSHVRVKSRMPEYGYSIFFTFDNEKF